MTSSKRLRLWFSQSRWDFRESKPSRRAKDCATAEGCLRAQTKPVWNCSPVSSTRRQNGHRRAVLGSLNAQTGCLAAFARSKAWACSTKGFRLGASISASSLAPTRSHCNAKAASTCLFSSMRSRSSQWPLALSDAGSTARLSPSATPRACRARVARLVPDLCMPTTRITRLLVAWLLSPMLVSPRLCADRPADGAERTTAGTSPARSSPCGSAQALGAN